MTCLSDAWDLFLSIHSQSLVSTRTCFTPASSRERMCTGIYSVMSLVFVLQPEIANNQSIAELTDVPY